MEAQSPNPQTTEEVPSTFLRDVGLYFSCDVFVGLGIRVVLCRCYFLAASSWCVSVHRGPCHALGRLLCQSCVASTPLSVSAYGKSTSLGKEEVSAPRHVYQLSQGHQ